MLDLNWFLELPSVRAGLPLVLAGRDKLETPVRWIHLGEHVNAGFYLAGGEVLITYGLGMGRTRRDHAEYVRHLVESGAAAIVLELGTVFAQAPEDLVQECKTAALPLIVLQRPVAFVTISQEALTHLVNDEAAALNTRREATTAYTRALLDQQSARGILERLTHRTGRAAALLDRTGAVAYLSCGGEAESDLLLRLRQEQPNTALLRLPLPAPVDHEQLVLFTEGAGEPGKDRIEAEEAVQALGVALSNATAPREHGIADVDSIILDMLEAPAKDNELALRAVRAGLDPHHLLPFALVVVTSNGRDAVPPQPERWSRALRRAAHSIDDSRATVLITPIRPGEAYGLVGVNDDDGASPTVDALQREVNRLLGSQRKHATQTCAVLGRPARTWLTAAHELRGIVDAVAFVRSTGRVGSYDAAEPDIERLLWYLRTDTAVRRFVEERLAPVRAYDAAHRASLMETLGVYFSTGGSKAEAARLLQVERPTVYDRISRIEQLLGIELTDPTAAFGVNLAILANETESRATDVS